MPVLTNAIEHKVMLTTNEPVRCKTHPCFSRQHTAVNEIYVKHCNIQRSESAYNFPVVLVNKKDGSLRFYVLYNLVVLILLQDLAG